MSYLLRAIREKMDWLEPEGWTNSEEAPSDLISDFKELGLAPKWNLSFWRVDADQTNLDQIITAMGATKKTIDIFVYALVPEVKFTEAGIVPVDEIGETPYTQANKYHCNVGKVSIADLHDIINVIYKSQTINWRDAKSMRKHVIDAAHNNLFDFSKMKPELIDFLGRQNPPKK